MASESEEAKSSEKVNDTKCEEKNRNDERLCNEEEKAHEKETENEFFDAVKDEFEPSDNESETFEDAIEDIEEKCSDLNVKDSAESEEKQTDNGQNSDDEDSYLEPSIPLTEEEKMERKTLAEEHKTKGNEFFKRSEFPEARELYTAAIKTCPPEFTKEKSIFYSNRAACLVRMELYENAVRDSTKALELNPEYLKARLRRAQCYEHEDKLEEALEDYQKVLEADKSSTAAREACMRLPEQIKVKHEKMKEEMMGKLKDLGNLFLKPFGLSTNNFQFEQDPNTGGYSVNFKQ